MTNVVLFVTPKSLVKIASKSAEFVPILGPTVEYTKKAKKMTDLADPVSATSRGIGMMFNYCFGKTAAVSVECVLWLGFSVAGGITVNPTLIAIGAQFGNMVVDEFLD